MVESDVSLLISKIESTAKEIRLSGNKQIFSKGVKLQLHEIASHYFSYVHELAMLTTSGGSDLDQIFQEIHASSRKNPSKSRCLFLLKTAKTALIGIEGHSISKSATQRHRSTPADELIITTLNDICPSASLAYQQALADCSNGQRLSWRGPATDLREALRETLDVLAPDADVVESPGFKLEQDAKRPTMKQKVRYILKRRGVPSGSMETPETAVTGIEDIVGGLTRSIYTRSSVSTHTATTQQEVMRVHAWVRLVLCELLEVPL